MKPKLRLIDTHCHVHEEDYPIPTTDVIAKAHKAGVEQMICIGTNEKSSKRALELASKYDEIFATIGTHPHYDNQTTDWMKQILIDKTPKLVAIGEIGLDYFRSSISRQLQIKNLEEQIDLAVHYDKDLPFVFHVREAFEDFWSVLDNFKSYQIRGVLHCFTGNKSDAEEGLNQGFYFALNGISTFTKDDNQRQLFSSLPLDKIILETDAPFLTPGCLRGKININEPAFIREIAEFNSNMRQMSLIEFSNITTANARTLFKLK